LSRFNCEKNNDVAKFLKEKSLRFERADKSRTYLVISEENILNEDGTLKILAYFTVAKKVITLPTITSKNKRKKYDGISNSATEINCFLIGQLGKNDEHKTEIEGSTVLEYAINIIKKGREYIGGRVVLIECEDKPKLINFYVTNNQFEHISKDKKTGLLQLVYTLNNVAFEKAENSILDILEKSQSPS